MQGLSQVVPGMVGLSCRDRHSPVPLTIDDLTFSHGQGVVLDSH